MVIITNYPNVPIATTNVATDSARNENEHKSSVAPTDKVTKPHEERAIDPEKERDSQQQRHEQQNQHNKTMPEDDVTLSEELEQESLNAQEKLAVKYAALSRKDIKVYAKSAERNNNEHLDSIETENALKQENVKQIKENLNSAYQPQETKPKSKLSEWG